MELKTDVFFQKAIQSLARALAHISPTPEDKVRPQLPRNESKIAKRKFIDFGLEKKNYFQFQQLFRYCPQESSAGVFCIDARAHEAVVALGLYFLESEYQYENVIVPYLLRLLKGLPKSIHKDEDPKVLAKKVDSK